MFGEHPSSLATPERVRFRRLAALARSWRRVSVALMACDKVQKKDVSTHKKYEFAP